jgi:hypothetical protein
MRGVAEVAFKGDFGKRQVRVRDLAQLFFYFHAAELLGD